MIGNNTFGGIKEGFLINSNPIEGFPSKLPINPTKRGIMMLIIKIKVFLFFK